MFIEVQAQCPKCDAEYKVPVAPGAPEQACKLHVEGLLCDECRTSNLHYRGFTDAEE